MKSFISNLKNDILCKRTRNKMLSSYLSREYFGFDSNPHASACIKCQVSGKRYKAFKKDLGIFISDHNFRDVMNVCDEIILLNQGEVLLQGTPTEVKNDPVAKKLYFGELN